MHGVLSSNIKQLRSERGVTQAELARAVGVSVQAVSKWECGGTPDVELLPAIADYFAVTTDELFGRKVGQGVSTDELAYKIMQNTPEKLRMERAGEICWAIFKGLSGIPNVSTAEFATGSENGSPECSRSRLALDTGIAYLCALEDAKSFFIFPEPLLGYSSVIASAENLAELFSVLADVDIMKTLLFLGSRNAVPFSIEHICKALELPQEKMLSCLSKLKGFGWLEEELVDLDSGAKTLYRPVLTEAFLAFLYFATEIRYKIRLWYLSNNPRVKPLLD